MDKQISQPRLKIQLSGIYHNTERANIFFPCEVVFGEYFARHCLETALWTE